MQIRLGETVFATPAIEPSRGVVVAVYCSDWRYARPVGKFVRSQITHGKGADKVVVPGGCADFSRETRMDDTYSKDFALLQSVHNISEVVMIAHEDCAWYKTSGFHKPEDILWQQMVDLYRAVQRLKSLLGIGRFECFYAHGHQEKTVLVEKIGNTVDDIQRAIDMCGALLVNKSSLKRTVAISDIKNCSL